MPRAGFNSITVSDDIYEEFYQLYEKNLPKLKRDGVNSFAGFVVMLAYNGLRMKKYDS